MNRTPLARGFSFVAVFSDNSGGPANLCFTQGARRCPTTSADPMTPNSGREVLSVAGRVAVLNAVGSFTGAGTGPVWRAAAAIPAPFRGPCP